MSWKKYGLIAAISLILVCFAMLAFLMPGEGVSRLIAVFAILITVGKMAYDIWKKEGESKERVNATPGVWAYDTAEIVGVELYNAGSIPVAIKRVALVVKTATGDLPEFMPSERVANSSENNYFQESSTLPDSVSRLELGPKKHAKFRLDRHTERTVDWLLKQPADSFWIVVESFLGEVARVSGSEIQAAILNTPYGRAIRMVELKLEGVCSVNASSPIHSKGR